MVEPLPNMDPDDVMSTHEVEPDIPPEQPISEQEGEDQPRAGAHPETPGPVGEAPREAFESIRRHLQEINPGVKTVEVNERPGLAVGPVPFLALVEEDMAFRLAGEQQHLAWRLDASKLWDIDPQVHDAPESEWVLVRYKHSAAWQEFAEDALAWASRSQ